MRQIVQEIFQRLGGKPDDGDGFSFCHSRFQKSAGSTSDLLLMVLPSGEGCIGDVLEPDLNFIAAETLVKVVHYQTHALVMLAERPAKVERFEGRIPGCPEGQPGCLI